MFAEPTKGYPVYTKSNCPACTKLKEELPDATYINCDDYLEDADEFLDFIWALPRAGGVKTFPMVFKDGVFCDKIFTTNATF